MAPTTVVALREPLPEFCRGELDRCILLGCDAEGKGRDIMGVWDVSGVGNEPRDLRTVPVTGGGARSNLEVAGS